MKPALVRLFLVLMLSTCAAAQFTTPVIDGAIGAGEYGNTNSIGTGTAQTWYMTWDDTNLYVAVTNANLSEGAVIYIDDNPVSPVNGGTNANGNLSGFNYDGEQFTTLPFRADFVAYFKDGYREFRTADGSGGWSGPTASFGTYASNGTGNVRELSIPWVAVTGGGRPAQFNFLVFLTSSGGYIYGQAPGENPGAFVGTSAVATNYFSATDTGNGSSTPPFSMDLAAPNTSPIDFTSLKHDTFDSYYRSPFGAVTEGSTVTLRFRTAHFGVDGVSVRQYLFDTGSGNTTGPVDVPMSFFENTIENGTTYDVWTATLTTPSAPSVLYYKFKVVKGASTAFYSDDYLDGNDNLNAGGTGKATLSEPFDSFQITVYDANFQTPAWLQNANVYHIFPDRFRDGDSTNDYCVSGAIVGCPTFYGSQQAIAHTTWNEAIFDPYASGRYNGDFSNQFYGGDLKGIQDELDYIQGLGFDAIYLNPIFAARSNHRYDTDNYLQIDPALGGQAAFQSLVTETQRRGMKLILDGVFNHASSDSLYFDRYNRYRTEGACESLSSIWRTWFHFNDNNVPCTSADYPGWFGFDSLPTFDHTNAAVRDFFFRGTDNVTEHWYSAGASGWRFDVADDGNFPHNWWTEYRTYAKGYKSDGPLIGEIWPNASQWLAGDQMDSVMNYRFRKNVLGFVRGATWSDNNNNGNNAVTGLKPSEFDHALRAVLENYPLPATEAMLNLLDSHDTNRALYVLTESGDSGLTQAKQRLELAALFQFTFVGAPMVFYGDEAGMNSPSLYSSSSGPVGDPYTRAPYPWPDQSGDPTIYGPPDPSLITYYGKLAHLRKQYPVLRTGSFQPLLTGDTQEAGTAANTYAFARSDGSQTAVVALNDGAISNTANVPVSAYFADGSALQDPITGNNYTVSGGAVTVTLAARSGVVLLPAPASLDLVPPTAEIELTPDPNANGWFKQSPVAAAISATDDSSGVAALRYWIDGGAVNVVSGSSASAQISGEGRHTIAARAFDNADNVSVLASQNVNIDLTPPTVTCQSPAPVFYLKQAGTTVSATVADALSGPVASSISAAAPTTMVGAQSVSLTGYDLAGNFTSAACSYSVVYRFGGFLPPIGSGLNAVSAGQSVPVQFSLNGNQGLNILAAGSPSAQQVACASGTAMGPKMPTSPAGSSSLSYNSTSSSYTYVWKTDKAWSGTCRQLQLMLIDGTTHTALFQFN